MKTKFERDVNGLYIKLLAESNVERQLLEEFTAQKRIKKKKTHYGVQFIAEEGMQGLKFEKVSTVRHSYLLHRFDSYIQWNPEDYVGDRPDTLTFNSYIGVKGNRLFVTLFSVHIYVIELSNSQIVTSPYPFLGGLGHKSIVDGLMSLYKSHRLKLNKRDWQQLSMSSYSSYEQPLSVKVLGRFKSREEFEALSIPKNLTPLIP